ncbi:MAG: translation initiation factor IF-2 N-terminal domain-containing protein [Phycisphaerales bacterium]|nr:translation initiation factor IF-2 N-terminal domain-containing protein [Phycisphaerales bacterium]
MAKKGIKVKDLARELGVTSREVIDRCRAEGLAVQNSITKLNVECERRVRGWFGGHSETTLESDKQD